MEKRKKDSLIFFYICVFILICLAAYNIHRYSIINITMNSNILENNSFKSENIIGKLK